MNAKISPAEIPSDLRKSIPGRFFFHRVHFTLSITDKVQPNLLLQAILFHESSTSMFSHSLLVIVWLLAWLSTQVMTDHVCFMKITTPYSWHIIEVYPWITSSSLLVYDMQFCFIAFCTISVWLQTISVFAVENHVNSDG